MKGEEEAGLPSDRIMVGGFSQVLTKKKIDDLSLSYLFRGVLLPSVPHLNILVSVGVTTVQVTSSL